MTSPDRDRDAAGRARNARPRDRLGRPLPRGAQGDIETIPDDFELPPAKTLAYAQRLLDDGLAFSAHEVLEAAWKNGPDTERDLWQGLAQLAVGVTHIQRGNRTGAASLLRRGADHLARLDSPGPYGVDVPGLLQFAAELIDALNSGAEIAPQRLHPRLVA
ncbi:DUF309 domain-containing protein [Mycobacterium sp. M1]|uniref:DUF309 domain-containing protein n=1 Tax=Mycolicibacter acidiphilus TaxID=2835306 RepID=A0ABS5RJD1_9MYCO|nr:DUF309 domain-containing protein [Mycolicibacter acidiphilus]MBS9534365.1 DUF309 domain-containing protein [Mycolicibacter acidiphilus]